ncbi:hypothetical protein [Maribacter sp. 2-571]|uniref:hypothetical protein n=1 Tax=Maribacter sp. 2-571 TaxID=3417569 RepID=UPI003D350230
MPILRKILSYLPWALLSILVCIAFKYVQLGPSVASENRLQQIFDIRDFIIYALGSLVGIISFTLFLILDLLWFKRKWKRHRNSEIYRTVLVVALGLFASWMHTVLEFELDWF